MSNLPTGKKYIGLAYNKPTSVESETYADYQWTLVKGDKGADGSNGSDGNGIASIAYTYATSQSFTGTKSAYSPSMFTLSATNKYGWQKEVITFTNGTTKTTEANIAVYGDKGDAGATGQKGDTGATGSTGASGADAVSAELSIKIGRASCRERV